MGETLVWPTRCFFAGWRCAYPAYMIVPVWDGSVTGQSRHQA